VWGLEGFVREIDMKPFLFVLFAALAPVSFGNPDIDLINRINLENSSGLRVAIGIVIALGENEDSAAIANPHLRSLYELTRTWGRQARNRWYLGLPLNFFMYDLMVFLGNIPSTNSLVELDDDIPEVASTVGDSTGSSTSLESYFPNENSLRRTNAFRFETSA
jgi:hypothetical protein